MCRQWNISPLEIKVVYHSLKRERVTVARAKILRAKSHHQFYTLHSKAQSMDLKKKTTYHEKPTKDTYADIL